MKIVRLSCDSRHDYRKFVRERHTPHEFNKRSNAIKYSSGYIFQAGI